MKKLLTFVAAALMLAACNKAPYQAPNPIMPIHISGETTHIYMTDYMPALSSLEGVSMGVENYDITGMTNMEFDLVRDEHKNIEILRVEHNAEVTEIVILPEKPVINALTTTGYEKGQLTIGLANSELTLSTAIVMLGNEYFDHYTMDEKQILIDLSSIRTAGRTWLRVYAETEDALLNDILVPLQDGKPVLCTKNLNRHDDQAQILYSLLIDRFNNGNTANDWKMNSPEVLDVVDYQGGDFAGITAKIRDGFFEELGITTLWISPITQNPYDAWGFYPFSQNEDGTYNNKYDNTRAYTKFSGYHGYWPIYITKVEERFGTDAELRELLATAHAHGMNVVLDYVANHMHINAPFYQEHPEAHTDSILPDGRRNFELWDEARLTTWFDVHIPSLDLEKEYVYEPMTDSALYWLENFDLDGFRHDACKHIPEIYWRTFGHKLATRFPDRHIWMIGETYGDPQLIGSYVKTGMLPAQFDFNIYHTAIDVLTAHYGKNMLDMSRTIEESLAAYGAHHTMGNISDNHDKCRFISLAGGAVSWDENDKLAGWTRNIGITADDNDNANDERKAAAYRAAMLLEVINMTIPGVPCIYQGDEYAEPGANDPDNRGMMRFSGLSEDQQTFRAGVQQLAALRRNNMTLLYGDYIPVSVDENTLCFQRIYMGEVAEVVISLTGETSITINGEKVFSI